MSLPMPGPAVSINCGSGIIIALEALEKINQRLSGQLLVVLCGDLHANLQVLSDICGEHGSQALQAVLHAESAEEIDQPIGGQQTYLDYMQLASLKRADREAEQGRRFGVALHFEGSKRGGMAFDRLRTLPLHRVQLHGTHDARLLGTDAHQQQPILLGIGAGSYFLCVYKIENR
nr:unnamed protein product [Callosobruchus analis]